MIMDMLDQSDATTYSVVQKAIDEYYAKMRELLAEVRISKTKAKKKASGIVQSKRNKVLARYAQHESYAEATYRLKNVEWKRP
jgi:hypothetical protein